MAEKNTMIIGAVIIVAMILLMGIVILTNYSNNGVNPNEIDRNTISVSGSSTQEVKPDQSEVYITIRTEKNEAASAQVENSEFANKVIQALKDKGIKEDNIETMNYRLEQIEEWNYEKQRSEKKGIRVVNSIKVTLEDVQKTGNIIDATTLVQSTPTTIVQIDSIQFTLTEEKRKDIYNELLVKASEDAKEKAESIAKGLGAKIITKPLSVSEANVYIPIYYGYDRAVATMAEGKAMDIPPTPINPSSVTATANINIVYKLD